MNKMMRETRKALGMTVRALAVAAGSSPPTISYIELYDHTPGPELRLRIANALGLTPEDLWPADDDQWPRLRQDILARSTGRRAARDN